MANFPYAPAASAFNQGALQPSMAAQVLSCADREFRTLNAARAAVGMPRIDGDRVMLTFLLWCALVLRPRSPADPAGPPIPMPRAASELPTLDPTLVASFEARIRAFYPSDAVMVLDSLPVRRAKIAQLAVDTVAAWPLRSAALSASVGQAVEFNPNFQFQMQPQFGPNFNPNFPGNPPVPPVSQPQPQPQPQPQQPFYFPPQSPYQAPLVRHSAFFPSYPPGSDADNGCKLAIEDMRRVAEGQTVYFANWIKSAGAEYLGAYMACLTALRGVLLDPDASGKVRIVIPASPYQDPGLAPIPTGAPAGYRY